MNSKCLACLFCVFVNLYMGVKSDRTRLKIYEDIQSDIFCFRRMNATHQIGCASYRNGNIGVVQVVDDENELQSLVASPPHPSFVVAIPVDLFNMGNMTLLKSVNGIQGVIILREKKQNPPKLFSPDQACPNRDFGFYTKSLNPKYAECKSVKWNKLDGNLALGMMYEDWEMPIFVITNETSIWRIRKMCYEKFNKPVNGTPKSWPLCSVQLNSVMLGAKDSDTCMRRSRVVANLNQVKTCDPLSDKNIVTMLFPNNKSEEVPDRSIIVVGCRLDAFSMFDRLAPGAHSTVTGLVTLLTVASTMASVREELQSKMGESKKNVLFAIFNGEAFDYIGSSRVVFDMQKGVFPVAPDSSVTEQPALVNLNHISHFIELSQLAPPESSPKYWVHSDPVTTANISVEQEVSRLFKILSDSVSETNISVSRTKAEFPLPPASFQSFLRHDSGIPGIVITDHEREFLNRYYNSMFDTDETLQSEMLPQMLADLAMAISKTLYELLTGSSPKSNLKPDEELVVGLNPIGDCVEILWFSSYGNAVAHQFPFLKDLHGGVPLVCQMLLTGLAYIHPFPPISGLLECYLRNASCDLFRQIADPSMTERLLVEPYPLYISVHTGSHQKANAITLYTRYMLAYLTGSILEDRTRQNCTSDNKTQIYHYDWMTGRDVNSSGICVKSTVMYTLAESPASELDDWKSSEYSTWTESVWLETSARIFLQPSREQEVATLVTGIFIFLFSIACVYFTNKRSSIIFNTKPLISC